VLLWRWIVAQTWWVGLTVAFAGLAIVDAMSVSLLGRTINHLPEYLGVLRAVPIFIVGMTLARAKVPLSRVRLAAPMLLLAGAGLLMTSQVGTPLELLSTLATGLLILGAEGAGRFSSAIIARLAKWAFPLFLVHTPTLAVWSVTYRAVSEGRPAAVDWAAWSFGFILSVLVAAGFSTWIDEPLAKRSWRPRKPSLPVISANAS
jgi:peptidoglycan/LPS O-acetylase OafA/YrhL